jgi:molecular chaperone GrpE (heat shock protein)
MDVHVGDEIDYTRHEPFDVESDPTLRDEHVKAIIRKGYEYAADNGLSCVLRPAQVVAVKNV